MSTNRRQFLIGAGFTGFCLAGAGKLLSERVNSASDGIGSGNENLLATVPTPKTELLQRFAVIADTGSSTKNQYAVGRAMTEYHKQKPFTKVLMVGDNIYNNGEIEKIKVAFEMPYADLLRQKVKFYAALGNHDVRTDGGDRQVKYLPFNMQGKPYYTHGQGEIKFFVLETSSLVDPLSPTRAKQLAWLDRELAASKARWNIVYGHHNIYSAGRYPDNEIMKADVSPILKKHKVPLWINGHDHNYQRWAPIDGTTYLTCGGGGATLYPILQPNRAAFARSVHSFGIVEVYKDQILLIGVDIQGQVIDRGLVSLT